MSNDDFFETCRKLLINVLEHANVDSGHGIDHADIVVKHAEQALNHQDSLSDDEKLAVRLAALLHDADDSKFFPNSIGNSNANMILDSAELSDDIINLTIRMISLVSCSKNRNETVKPAWLLIPRWADRLEAMGDIGIKRCFDYTMHTKRPLFLSSTPRATTPVELAMIATPERFAEYRGKSASMMDHFYDKLLHLVNMKTNNEYLVTQAQLRHEVLVNYCLEFGRTGMVSTPKPQN